MLDQLVIVSCGKRKAETPCTAEELYTGTYFRALLAHAKRLAPVEHIRILSAKYGLLPLNRKVEPYNLRMGEPGSVCAETLRRQAIMDGTRNAHRVVVLAGARYASICRAVWGSRCTFPLAGMGIGKQLHYLSNMEETHA